MPRPRVGDKKYMATEAEMMAILPHAPPGATVPELAEELNARNPHRQWGRMGAHYHIRYKLLWMARSGLAEPTGRDGRWQTWVAKTTA